ncbi:MAG: peptidoglycan bridge formation glycyltransferase FemA/FemB family protein [Ardenticatenia bacterium]|nr:peptidoglycan bridge formation glycyltransferase FemA/FemB family protein [Ardenticatenia bacterium]
MAEFRGQGRDWDQWVLKMPRPHLLQSADWGALKERWGWTAARFKWTAAADATDSKPLAVAQVLMRRLGRLPLSMGYVARGPLVDDGGDASRWRRPLLDLAAWARQRGLLYLKMDPDVARDRTDLSATWRELGWRPSAEQIQFAHTMTSDLDADEVMMAGMHAKTRYNIGLAARRGVVVRDAGIAGIDAFLDLYGATGRRAGFGLRAPTYYRDLIEDFHRRGQCTVLLAEREGEPLAAVIPVVFGPTAWYLYGASGERGREHMPAFAAQWESLRWARDRGCRRYDWWGGPDPDDPADPLWGVARFKAGFGAVLTPQLGAWDLSTRPAAHALYRRLAAWRLERIVRGRMPTASRP